MMAAAAAACGPQPHHQHHHSGGGGSSSTAASSVVVVVNNNKKTTHANRENNNARRSRENSRRRQAALLFLSNISLDGRPVVRSSSSNVLEHGGGNRHHHNRELDFEGDFGAAAAVGLSPATAALGLGGYETFPGGGGGGVLSTSVSCGNVNSGGHAAASPPRRLGVVGGLGLPLLNVVVPPILVLPSDSSSSSGCFNDMVGSSSAEVLLPVPGGSGSCRGSFSSSQSNLLSASPSNVSLLSPGGGGGAAGGGGIPGPRKSSTLLSVQSCTSVSSEPRQRSRNLSGSPRPRVAKKVHFIKNMRQYDTRGSRIVLICAKRSLCAAFSVLPYGESFHISDPMLNHPRRRHSSGNISTTLEMLPGLEGFHLDAYGKTVSYAQFLYPTNALVRQKQSSAGDLTLAVSRSTHSMPGRSQTHTVGLDLGVEDLSDYDPNILSDPQWPCGKHKRVLIFASYMTTVIEYVKPSDLKRDMNETFKEKYPHIKLTLSKIRSLKREMCAVREDCGLQPVTIAMAFVYFEKLVLQGRLNKHNRKLVSAACVLLAAKISSDLRKQEVKHLIDKLEERFRISRRDLIPFEFTILVALEMALYLPESKVLPHYRRLVQQQQL